MERKIKTFGELVDMVDTLKHTISREAIVYGTMPDTLHIVGGKMLEDGPPHEPVIIIVD